MAKIKIKQIKSPIGRKKYEDYVIEDAYPSDEETINPNSEKEEGQ